MSLKEHYEAAARAVPGAGVNQRCAAKEALVTIVVPSHWFSL